MKKFLMKIKTGIKRILKIFSDLPRKKKIIFSVITGVVSLLLVVAITVTATVNLYLNKINYGDVSEVATATPEAMKELDEQENISFDIVDSKEISDSDSASASDSVKKDYSDYLPSEDGLLIRNEEMGKDVQTKADKNIAENLSNSDVWYSDNVYNLLIVGYDAGDVENSTASSQKFYRSDAVIIASINKTLKKVKLISLSRATYVAVPGHGNKRLNTAHAYGGASLLVETIEKNYKIRIDKYVTVNFDGFKKIIDALGGVQIDLTAEEANFAFNTSSLGNGKYMMNGSQTLRYVRLRKTDSDRVRTGRQRKVLANIKQKSATMSLSQKLSFLDTALPYVTTNMSKSEVVSTATEFSNYLDWPMEQYIVPKRATQYEMRDGLEVIIVDWEETTKYIHSIVYNGTEVKKA